MRMRPTSSTFRKSTNHRTRPEVIRSLPIRPTRRAISHPIPRENGVLEAWERLGGRSGEAISSCHLGIARVGSLEPCDHISVVLMSIITLPTTVIAAVSSGFRQGVPGKAKSREQGPGHADHRAHRTRADDHAAPSLAGFVGWSGTEDIFLK